MCRPSLTCRLTAGRLCWLVHGHGETRVPAARRSRRRLSRILAEMDSAAFSRVTHSVSRPCVSAETHCPASRPDYGGPGGGPAPAAVGGSLAARVADLTVPAMAPVPGAVRKPALCRVATCRAALRRPCADLCFGWRLF